MTLNPIVLSIPIYFVLIVLEWSWDLYTGKKHYTFEDALGNIGCGLTQQLTNLLSKVGVVALYTWIYSEYRFFDIEHTWYGAFVLFVLIDFCYYWAHRLSHEVNLFWVGHVVHHQSEEYNFSVALRQGTFQTFFTSPFYWPLALLGFDPYWFLYIGAFVTLYQFWIHTEYIKKMGWFEFVFNTPSHHRVHHATDAQYIDKNHGGTLIIWDRMFGTFIMENEAPTYGITNPLNSFNPVYATLHPVVSLWKRFVQTPGVNNKLQVLFRSPAWKYENEIETTDVTAKPSTNGATKKVRIYTGIWFLLVIGLAANLLFNYQNYDLSFNVFYVFGLLFSLWSIGNLNDGLAYAKKVEVLRSMLVVGVLLWFLWQSNLSGLI